jgi:hypothetical protein
MLINEISTGGPNTDAEFRELALATLYANFPLAMYAHFYSFSGNSDTPRKSGSEFDAGQTRTVSTGYVAKERQPRFGQANLKIYGDKVATDIANNRRGIDIGNQRIRDLEKFCAALGRYLMHALINHDTGANATHTNGLKALAEDIGQNVVLGGANGLALPRGNDNAASIAFAGVTEALDENIEDIDGGVDAIIANSTFITRLGTMGSRFVQTDTVQDIYGENQRVTSYKGIPLVNAGWQPDRGGYVIGNDETVGTSTDCTSVYLVNYGEEEDVTIASNVGIDVIDLGNVEEKIKALVELDIDQVVLNERSLKRLSGIRAKA